MSAFHLNHFYNNPCKYYSDIPLQSLQLLEEESKKGEFSLFSLNNVLLHGFDLSLNEFYANTLLSWHNKNTPLIYTENLTTVDSIDVVYYSSKHSIKLNFNKQTNKEKNASIAFIKQLTAIKNAYYEKHIIFLAGMDKLGSNMQYRMRRIIEKTSAYCIYISTTNNVSKITNPIKSRFLCLRVPALSYTNHVQLGKHFLKQFMSQEDDDGKKSLHKDLTTFIKKNVIYLQDLLLSIISYSIHSDEFEKNFKMYNFTQTELNGLFKYMQKTTINTFDLIENIRTVIYKINHYNSPVNQISMIVLETFTTMVKSPSFDQLSELVEIVSNFEHLTIKINNCKIIYAYENMFLAIFRLIKRI